MLDYKEKIAEFISQHFTDSTADEATVRWNNNDFLSFLFQVYPKYCISDYDLDAILNRLGFEKRMYSIECISVKKVGDKEMEEVSYQPCLGWCLESSLIPKPFQREKVKD